MKVLIYLMILIPVLMSGNNLITDYTSLKNQTKIQAFIIVAKDGSGDFCSIQEAINSVRDLVVEQVVIYIKKGKYNEKVVVPSWKTHISLVGENEDSTIISNNDFSGKPIPGGKDVFAKEKFSTYTSYTLLVQGNDFTAENLTVQNTAGRVGQAVALSIEGDRIVIKHCKILGNQDTLYAAKEKSRQYYEDCLIEGTTDFIFGEATALFKNCILKSLNNSYITAAATRQNQAFGFVFLDCKLLADTGVTKVYLGRPWRPYAKTVFIHCELGAHILPEGWNPWKGDAMFPDKEKTSFYAEALNIGPGATVKKRVSWSKQLSKKELRSYSLENILGGSDHWNPRLKENKVG